MKPIIKYRGGKSRELPEIMKYVPRFRGRYIEPFVGGGAVFFHLEPQRAIINDINDRLMNFYQNVRDNYETLRNELDEIETIYTTNRREFEELKRRFPNERVQDKNESMYYQLRDMYNGLAPKLYSDALLYFYINKTAYSGMIRFNANGEFNVPYGRYQHLNTKVVSRSHHLLLQKSQLYNTDYSTVFNMSDKDDFMFLDPPYDCTFSDYGNEAYREGFNEAEHRRLAQDFRNLSCKTLMILGKTPLTQELYTDYLVGQYDKSYSVNIRNRFKAGATHLVIANFDINEQPIHGEYAELETKQVLLFEKKAPYGKN